MLYTQSDLTLWRQYNVDNYFLTATILVDTPFWNLAKKTAKVSFNLIFIELSTGDC